MYANAPLLLPSTMDFGSCGGTRGSPSGLEGGRLKPLVLERSERRRDKRMAGATKIGLLAHASIMLALCLSVDVDTWSHAPC
jgi:hypothetical protein